VVGNAWLVAFGAILGFRLVLRLSFVRRQDVWNGCFQTGLVQLPDPDLRIQSEAVGDSRDGAREPFDQRCRR
jgi:hypothetical protein